MRRLIAVLLFASFAAGVRADAIDDYITAQMARQHIPGLALAIMRHGQLARIQGYGIANLEHSVPVHPDTLFESGAMGMQFTAVAVMLLVEEGKLRLDESIRTYLPDAPRSWAPITLRQLLNHTSGLPATPNGDFRTDYTDDELLGIIYKQELNFPAGTRWRFSYTEYVTLGFIIKKVSGEFYADLLARRVFGPLGMQTARLIDSLAVVPNRGAGYLRNAGEYRHPDWVSPTANSTADGSLYLSALDLARWDAGIFGRKVLKPESWAEIARPARLASGSTYPYGFGWFLEHSAGQDVWRHSGSWQGFQTFIIRYLGDELTVVVLANSDGADPTRIARHVAGMVDPRFAQPSAAPIEDRAPQITKQLRTLLQQIADGNPDYEAFTFVSKHEFAETMAEYQKTVKPLGPPREIALFAHKKLADDQVYRYRARYDAGMVEVNLSFASDGKIGGFDLIPADDWNAPIQE